MASSLLSFYPLDFVDMISPYSQSHLNSQSHLVSPGGFTSFELLFRASKNSGISLLGSVACENWRYFRMSSDWVLFVICPKFMVGHVPSFSELHPVTF